MNVAVASPLSPDRSAGPLPRGLPGVGADTVVETARGALLVSDLVVGDVVLGCSGGVRVVDVVSFRSDDWVTLPAIANGPALVVAAGQVLRFRHFLCAALFGQIDVAFRAGDLTSPQVTRAEGVLQTLVCPVLETAARIKVSGYELPCYEPQAFLGAVGHLSVNEGAEAAAQSPHSASQDSPSLQASLDLGPLYLTPHDVQQLCQSGVIFRGGRK